ncbi:hypothetical protein AcV7_004911 [Taiwanofungus camphoratus]|nr:hypothetical protein AcV7_004911 [Antrodia cinnamomea]
MSAKLHIPAELQFLLEICQFLTSAEVESLLTIHPNRLCTSSFAAQIPPHWYFWWTWAGEREVGDYHCPNAHEHCASSLDEPKWLLLVRYYVSPLPISGSCLQHRYSSIPPKLRSLVDTARRLQLLRQPGPVCASQSAHSSSQSSGDNVLHRPVCDNAVFAAAMSGHSTYTTPKGDRMHGMSPKKAHEVTRMTEYTSRLLSSIPGLEHVKHVVDVGAGQAYLSRSLRDKLGLHVLALDWNEVQEKGAARKDVIRKGRDVVRKTPITASPEITEDNVGRCVDRQVCKRGSLTYKTMEITPQSLLEATDEWVTPKQIEDARTSSSATSTSLLLSPNETRPIPTLLVALHSCGSLTPNVLRVFISRHKTSSSARMWIPRAAVVVGCCYNLLDPKDFPLSRMLLSPSSVPKVVLTSNHLQLAAQIPYQWLRTGDALNAAKLAVRKVAWRALLEGILEERKCQVTCEVKRTKQGDDSVGENHCGLPCDRAPGRRGNGRIGRLSDSTYVDWTTFLGHVGTRFGIGLADKEQKDDGMESRLEVFHALRCILGPVVEALILLDRRQWLDEELQVSYAINSTPVDQG